jgi:hypothetical protein
MRTRKPAQNEKENITPAHTPFFQKESGNTFFAGDGNTFFQTPVVQTSPDPQPAPEPAPDEPETQVLAWDPEDTLMNYLMEYDEEQEAINAEDPAVEPSEDGPSEWIGTGDEGRRKEILLYGEIERLSHNADYKAQIVNRFEGDDAENQYLEFLKQQIDTVSGIEAATMGYLNGQLNMDLTPENFIDNSMMQSLNGADAFPDFAWDIVKDLIGPSQYLTDDVNTHYTKSKDYYEGYWTQMALDMFSNGLPVSYGESLNLTYFRLIMAKQTDKLFNLPDQPWMKSNFISMPDPALLSPVMQHNISSFAYYGTSTVNKSVLDKWSDATRYKWMSYNTKAISDFRKEYPTGLTYLDQFYKFAGRGAGYTLGEIAFAAVLNLFSVAGQSPYKLLGLQSGAARGLAPDVLNGFVQNASTGFNDNMQQADSMISGMDPAMRLEKAVAWSLSKGFAGQSINMLLDNLDSILIDILKQWAKEKGIKKGVTTVVGIFGGPIGRLATFLYNVYDTADDIEDIVEITQMVDKLISIVTEARNAQTVIQMQKAAAGLAEATVSTIPFILQQLGSRVLDKLSKGIVKDDPGKLPEAQRHNLLDKTRKEPNVNKLTDAEKDAEITTAIKSKIYRSKDGNAAIIVLPNGHTWQRKNGIWCRASDECLVPFTNSKFIADLNSQVDRSIHSAPVFDPDAGHAPGVTPRGVVSTEVGTTHGKEFAVETLNLIPLDLPNPLTKSDFSDHGFDDIMADANGNWYIMEYKGGQSDMDPGTSTRPPQMSSAWVRHVIQRIRNKGPEWNFIADRIQDKLDKKQLYGYGISTPVNEAGVVQPTVIMPGYNNIQF